MTRLRFRPPDVASFLAFSSRADLSPFAESFHDSKNHQESIKRTKNRCQLSVLYPVLLCPIPILVILDTRELKFRNAVNPFLLHIN